MNMNEISDYIRTFLENRRGVSDLIESVSDIEIVEYSPHYLYGIRETAKFLDNHNINHEVVKKIIIINGKDIDDDPVLETFPNATIEQPHIELKNDAECFQFIDEPSIDLSHILVLHFATSAELNETEVIKKLVHYNSRLFYVLICNPKYREDNDARLRIPQPIFRKKEKEPTEFCKEKQKYIDGFLKKHQFEDAFFEGIAEVENGCNDCNLCDNYGISHKCPFFQHFIASLYRDGKFVPQNDIIAHNWDLMASKQGYKPARRAIAKDFHEGIGCEKNNKAAESIEEMLAYEGDTELAKRFAERGEKSNASKDDIIGSIIWRTRLANDGDFMSILKIANIYRDGKYGMPKSEKQHIEWLKKGAEAGSTVLTEILEKYYAKNGKLIDDNLLSLKLKAERGDCEAEYELSKYYREKTEKSKKNIENANRFLKLSAEHGYEPAKKDLAERLYWGDGIDKNLKKAFVLFKDLYDEGNMSIRFRLAYMYSQGEGTEINYSESLRLYSEIADQDSMAMNNLACLYSGGHGVEKDYKKAAELFEESANNGNSTAQCNIARYYQDGTGVQKDESKAIEWFKKAAEQGNTDALVELGLCYELAKGTERDYVKAADYYLKGAINGSTVSMTNLALAYEFGRGVEKDKETAAMWFKKAAELGNNRAQYCLGLLNENKEITGASFETAVYWYRKAARKGYTSAQDALKRLNLNWIEEKEEN